MQNISKSALTKADATRGYTYSLIDIFLDFHLAY